MKKINITVWNEYRHEKLEESIVKVYPNGIHNAIAAHLKSIENFSVRTSTLDEVEYGLADDVLNSTDVLIWWGHMAHDEVSDNIVDKVQKRVLDGMGIIVLHSGHASKIFSRLMGTETLNLRWREVGEKKDCG